MRIPAKEAIVGEIYNDLLDNGFRAVGVLPISVCTGEEAMDNWSNVGKGTSMHYPCN